MKINKNFLDYFKKAIENKRKASLCLNCLSEMGFRTENLLRCRRNRCRKQRPFIENRLFRNRKISFEVVAKIIYYWLKKYRLSQIAEEVEVTRITVKSVIKDLTFLFAEYFYSDEYKIGGENMIVEIDESKFGKRKYERGRRIEGIWVFGAVERSADRRIILQAVERRNRDSLVDIICRKILPGSKIYSDMWRGYSNLQEFGYSHSQVNHSREFVNRNTNTHTNTIEANWSALKSDTPKSSRRKKSIIPYLIRYMILRNISDNFDYKEFFDIILNNK